MKKALILILWLLASSAIHGDDVVKREGEPDVVNVADDDTSMQSAIERARETVGRFVEVLPELQQRGIYVSIKVPINEGDDVEHIWVADLRVEEGSFHGVLANQPVYGPLNVGDPVSTPVEQISDWLALINNELYGGFTIFVTRDKMGEEDRKNFERDVGFNMPAEPNVALEILAVFFAHLVATLASTCRLNPKSSDRESEYLFSP